MKKIIEIIPGFFILLVLSFNGFSQERILNGRVFTFDSIPLVNATVEVLSTKQVVKTDTLGFFSVNCSPDDKLKVSAHGFSTEKFDMKSSYKFAVINLKLKPGVRNREIAIGYGHVLDSDKLNAVSSMDNNDIDFSQYSNMYELIRGRFAGVQIVNNEIIIRGVNSINSSSAALIVLDGVPVDNNILSSLPPIQVKSVNIIKDASAAIYGSRGSNGVVLIETKKAGN
jgi:TonB-dependent SusC/RagA subfamily outer membrane receptor